MVWRNICQRAGENQTLLPPPPAHKRQRAQYFMGTDNKTWLKRDWTPHPRRDLAFIHGSVTGGCAYPLVIKQFVIAFDGHGENRSISWLSVMFHVYVELTWGYCMMFYRYVWPDLKPLTIFGYFWCVCLRQNRMQHAEFANLHVEADSYFRIVKIQ